VRLARGAAEIQLDGLRSGFAIDRKSAAGDLVTEIDRAAEHAIVEGIRDARGDDAILGEEGTDRAGTSGVRWVLDGATVGRAFGHLVELLESRERLDTLPR
jgi:myo-inositol-1(or 4)-monophosphatase